MTRASRTRILPIVLSIVALLGCIGCAGKRPPVTREELYALREQNAQENRDAATHLMNELLEHAKAEADAFAAGKRSEPPVLDMLVVSGGGDWGAFGAGFLKGWGTVQGEMARPKFDIVTGVSTGALIAPFAFLGDEESIDTVVHLYRNPQKDWVKQRWPLYFLPNNISFAEVPGLERELRKTATMDVIQRIAAEGHNGRMLLVNTTNVDDGTARIFDLTGEADRAVRDGNADRVHRIMLASAGIPGAFPFRIIDEEMYVDGGVTGNILYRSGGSEEASFPALWHQRYPDTKMPKMRYWIIFNNQTRPPPQVTAPTWPAVVSRSLEMATRSATVTAIRHIHANSEISRLKRKADLEVRLVHIPNDWVPPVPGVFIKETMNNLADMGERMGADPASWKTESP